MLIPDQWSRVATPQEVDAILAHELAHARRRDHLVNLAQRLVEVALFFHPAVHWLSRSLRREREHLADALAVRLTGDPLALAEALESIARLRLESPRISAAVASLGGPTTSLLPRIQELIGMTPSRPRLALWPFGALPAAGLFALLALSAGFAGDRPARPRVEVASGAATRSPEAPDPGRPMIEYCVRFIDAPAEPWRMLFLPRIKPLKQETEFNAWTLDDKAVADLLKHLQADTRSNCLSAPKVCADDGAAPRSSTERSDSTSRGSRKSVATSQASRRLSSMPMMESRSISLARSSRMPPG